MSASSVVSAILDKVVGMPVDELSRGRARLAKSVESIVGPQVTRRLAATHAADDFSDGLITLSLVGSLFFSVSLEASRGRILLYLLLTAAPLAIIAPVVGPALDHARAGYKVVVIGSHLGRSVFALLLAGSLQSIAFYPVVFGILLSRKAYELAKTAIIAHLVSDRNELVVASGHLARTGTIAGFAGTATGGALIPLVGVEWLPLAAAVGFACSAVLAGRIPLIPIDPHPVAAVVHVSAPVDLRRATAAVALTRAAAGALTFLLALSIKRGGGDKWIFVAALVAAGFGTFFGTVVSPRLHRALPSDRVVVLTLLVPGAVSAFGVLTIGSFSIIAIALTIGLGGSIASRSMDTLYGRVPTLVRGRVISRTEFYFQLANVGGAVLAVSAYPGPRVGFALVAVALIFGGLAYASHIRLSFRHEAGRWLLREQARDADGTLPQILLGEALRYADQGDHKVAVIIAGTAIQVLDSRPPERTDSTAQREWATAEAIVTGVAAGTTDATPEDSVIVIEAAEALVADRQRPPAPGGGGR